MKTAIQTKMALALDPAVPLRDRLLDENLMLGRLRERGAARLDSCEISRVKYRFGANLRVLYKLHCGELTLTVAMRTFERNRGALVCHESLKTAVPAYSLPPVFFDEELGAVFWTFPNDRKLSNLKILQNASGILAEVAGKRWTATRTVAYAPEKCATAECLDENDAPFAYAKVYADQAGRRAYHLYEALGKITNDKNDLRLPRALYYSEVHRTLILEAVEGERLADLSAENLISGYEKLGAAISALHNAKPPDFLPEFSRLKPEKIKTALEIIRKARPDVFAQARKLANKLCESFPEADESAVCLHGDVHPKNGIMNASGCLTLIDLDQASRGASAADCGSFLAAILYKESTGEISRRDRDRFSEAFLAGYAKNRLLPSEKSIAWHTATALLNERALRAINRVRREGLEYLPEILAVAGRILKI